MSCSRTWNMKTLLYSKQDFQSFQIMPILSINCTHVYFLFPQNLKLLKPTKSHAKHIRLTALLSIHQPILPTPQPPIPPTNPLQLLQRPINLPHLIPLLLPPLQLNKEDIVPILHPTRPRINTREIQSKLLKRSKTMRQGTRISMINCKRNEGFPIRFPLSYFRCCFFCCWYNSSRGRRNRPRRGPAIFPPEHQEPCRILHAVIDGFCQNVQTEHVCGHDAR